MKRGMSLVKKYSQMSEAERKKLIKQAFEAKQKLQEELKETQEKVKEKEKELEKMQHQVTIFSLSLSSIFSLSSLSFVSHVSTDTMPSPGI